MTPSPDARIAPCVSSPRPDSSLSAPGHFIHDAAERERFVRVLLRWVPPEYRWMLKELAKK